MFGSDAVHGERLDPQNLTLKNQKFSGYWNGLEGSDWLVVCYQQEFKIRALFCGCLVY